MTLEAPTTASSTFGILTELNNTLPGLRSLVLLSSSGHTEAVVGNEHALASAIAPFALGLSDLLARLCEDGGLGLDNMVLVQAEQGSSVMYRVGSDHLLIAFAEPNVRLGVMIHDLGVCARHLAAALP